MPRGSYSSASNKTKAAMARQYGAKQGERVFYALANKRTGGFKGKNRGSRAANAAFAKGSKWPGSGRRGRGGRSGVGSVRGGLVVR